MSRIPESDIKAEVPAENLALQVNSQGYLCNPTNVHIAAPGFAAARGCPRLDRIRGVPIADFLKTHGVDVHVSPKPWQELVS